MLAAAGIVVTETSTPTRALDFGVVRLSIPTTPASTATKKEKMSGFEMNLVRVWASKSIDAGSWPIASKNRVVRKARRVPSGKPIARALNERRASSGSFETSATQRPDKGPNSGPTIIAATIRIGWLK